MLVNPAVASALACHSERIGRSIDGDDFTGRANDLRDDARHVSEPRAQIEDTHPRCQAGSLKQQSGRSFDGRGLAIQSRQFLGMIAEDVAVWLWCLAFHGATSRGCCLRQRLPRVGAAPSPGMLIDPHVSGRTQMALASYWNLGVDGDYSQPKPAVRRPTA